MACDATREKERRSRWAAWLVERASTAPDGVEELRRQAKVRGREEAAAASAHTIWVLLGFSENTLLYFSQKYKRKGKIGEKKIIRKQWNFDRS